MTQRQGQAVCTHPLSHARIPVAGILVGMACFFTIGCAEEPPATGVAEARAARDARQPANPADQADATTSETQRSVGPVGTAFYESSPAQGRPPDGELAAGTTVELIEAAGSYSLVAWDGRQAWVASDALHPADPPRPKIHKIPMH